ncbi:MAG: GxxExxY protein [Acidobacteriota bacterium]
MEQERTTEVILGAAMEVSNVLWVGFLEKVYRRALAEELKMRGAGVREEVHFRVVYKGRCVGEYVADMVVDGCVVVELKCVERIGEVQVAQALNYLKASGLGVGLVVNFQRSKVQWRRVVMTHGVITENGPRMDADSHG